MGSNGTCQKLAAYLQLQLRTLPQSSPTSRCIYRVPEPLRQANEKTFSPILVSIGPFHHNNPNLLPMQLHKLKCLESFLVATKQNGSLDSYLQLVIDSQLEIRQCYANPATQLSPDEFICMVLLDSVFIIEFLRWNFDQRDTSEPYGTFRDRHIVYQIDRDIRLAENQLPFFILQDLYSTAFKPNGLNAPYFTDMACQYLKVDKTRIHIEATLETTCFSLLDFVLKSRYQPSKLLVWKDRLEHGNIMSPSATNLHGAGIKFVAADLINLCSLLDIEFDEEKAILTIPKMRLDKRLEVEFKNMLAFEQCRGLYDAAYLTYYLRFMDFLINTSGDVKLLVGVGIIENLLGSDEDVRDLFNTLAKHVVVDPYYYYYAEISEQLNRHCDKRWNRYRATLKHTYFKHPWAVISVIYAIVLLVLTIIQVVTGIISVV